MLRLLIGPSGSGKSWRIRRDITLRAEAGQRSILLVPEQFTSSTESMLYQALGDTASEYVDSYSFTSLAQTLLRQYGGAAVPTLSEAGRAVLVRRAMKELADKIVYYSRQRQSAAFCEKAAQTIVELKSAGISPQDLAAYANAPGADGVKLRELALLYDTYEALLRQTALDPDDRVTLAAKRLKPDFFTGKALFLDEFDNFNAPKRQMLEALLPIVDITVALEGSGVAGADDSDFSLFTTFGRLAGTLRRMAHRAGVLCKTEWLCGDARHAQAPELADLNLFLTDPTYTPQHTVDPQNPTIVKYVGSTRRQEAKAAAAAIRGLAQRGVPFSRMAVICRDASLYFPAVRYEFRLQDIPLFRDETTTPEHTPPARAVLAALELLKSGIGTRGILGLAKSGLVDLDEQDLLALDNYAFTWNLHAEDWSHPFTRSPAGYAGASLTPEDTAELQAAERARDFLVGRAEIFLRDARGAALPEMTKQLYLFLQTLGAEQSIEKLTVDLRARGEFFSADEAVREWNVVTGLLNELVDLLPADTELSAQEYEELFRLLLRTTDMGHIPQSLDSVIFTTANRMRLPEVDACFVLGIAEGEFPQLPGERGLLTHADRDAMIAQGADLPDCFENRFAMEQIFFYKALTAPRSFLWLSWPGGVDGAGALGLPPAGALRDVLRTFDVAQTRPALANLAATPAAALDLLGGIWQQPTAQRAALYEALCRLQGTPNAASGFAAVVRAAARDPEAVKDTTALEKLLGRQIRVSPTRLERYAVCPFAYFLQYVIRVKPRQKALLAPNISGTLTHWVLEQALSRSAEAFTALSHAQIEALTQRLVAEYAAQNLPGIDVRTQYLLQRIQRNLVSLLCFIRNDIRQSGFKPAAFELRIDDRILPGDALSPRIEPVVLEDAAGHTIRVVGTVDRVDAMQKDGMTYLRVVDYKTGSKKFDLREVYYGLDCQMLLYLFTLEQNGGALFANARAAGVEYLLADPSPTTAPRPKKEGEAQRAAKGGQAADHRDPDTVAREEDSLHEEEPDYPLDGLLLQDAELLKAMDQGGSGRFSPIHYSSKTGEPTKTSQRRLADEEKMHRIRDHLSGLLVDMTRSLYSGRIAAQPFSADGSERTCRFCEYRAVCGRLEGEALRTMDIDADPFAEPLPEIVGGA